MSNEQQHPDPLPPEVIAEGLRLCEKANELGMQNEPMAVTQVQAARLLSVTDRTIRNWERAKLLKGKRVRGVRLYPFLDVQRLAGVK